MRSIRLTTLAASAFALAACGGGEKSATDTTTVAPAANPPAESAVAPAPGVAATAGTAAAITGTTHDIKMVGDAKGYRFEPATLTVKAGDGIRFTNVSGGPHNVTFWPDSIPAGAASQLGANMPNTTAPMTGPLLVAPNQTYVVSLAKIPTGVYHIYCTPHLALGMKGAITVQ